MRMDGETTLVPRLAAERAIQRPVVGVNLLAVEHEVIAPEQVEMTIGRASIFLTGGDRDVAAADDRGFAQPAELGRVHFLHHARVRSGRFVVGQDRAEVDVLGLEQVEDDAVVGLGLAGEMKVRVARLVTERCHRGGVVEHEVNWYRLSNAHVDALHQGPILEPLPGLDAHGPGGDSYLDFSGRVEEPAEVADRRLAFAVPLSGSGPLAGEAVRRERMGRGLVEVAVGSNDVEPAGCGPAGGMVANGHPEPAGFLTPCGLRLAEFREAGRRDDERLVIPRGTMCGAQDSDCNGERDSGWLTGAGRPGRPHGVPINRFHHCWMISIPTRI